MIQVQNETNWKIWVGVGALGFVLVYLATFSAGSLVQKNAYEPEGASYSYQMPRVEAVEAPFDLSGRLVERKLIGALVSEKAGLGASPKAAPVGASKPSVKANAKKAILTPAQAKAMAAKKNAEAAKAKLVAKAKAQNEERRRRFQMQVLQEREKAKFQAEADAAGEWTPVTAGYSGGFEAAPATPDKASDDSQKKEDEDLNLSAAQWRTLLQVSPTAANVAKLVKAFGKGKIDATAFYEITKELLMDSAADRRKAGLMLVSSVASVATYEFMVLHQAELGPEAQAEVKKEIAKYSQPSYLTLTSRVIATSKESAVLSSALGNLASAIETYKKQPAPGTISGQGGAKGPMVTVSALSQFLNGLNSVGLSEDPLLAEQAKNLTRTIQEIKK